MLNKFEKLSDEEIAKAEEKAKDIMNDETMGIERRESALREKEYEIFESTGASPELLSKCQLTYENTQDRNSNSTEVIRGTIDGNEVELFRLTNKIEISSVYTGTINTNKIENEEDAQKLYAKYVEVAKMQSGEHVIEGIEKLNKELVDKLINL